MTSLFEAIKRYVDAQAEYHIQDSLCGAPPKDSRLARELRKSKQALQEICQQFEDNKSEGSHIAGSLAELEKKS